MKICWSIPCLHPSWKVHIPKSYEIFSFTTKISQVSALHNGCKQGIDQQIFNIQRIVLCNVFTPTRKTLDFMHRSKEKKIKKKHKYTKEDENVYFAVI